MKCPRCGHQNRPEARFCKQCGQALPGEAAPPAPPTVLRTVCPACGATARPGARFCPRCGQPLVAEPVPPTPPSPAQMPTQPSVPPATAATEVPSPPAFDAQLGIAATATELQAGDPVTITATLTNAGQVTFGSLRYQLLGEWEPYFRMTADAAVEHEVDVAPGQSDTATFVLEAVQAGTARLQANVTVKTQEDPPSLKPVSSQHVLEISVAQ